MNSSEGNNDYKIPDRRNIGKWENICPKDG